MAQDLANATSQTEDVEMRAGPNSDNASRTPDIANSDLEVFLMRLENGTVGWEGHQDPEYPPNFTSTRKWFITGLLSTQAFMTPFASSIIASAISYIASDFGIPDVTKSAMPCLRRCRVRQGSQSMIDFD